MPRIGQNPMKWVHEVHQPQKITATTVVHIPALEGYWQESLEVLKLCLSSMRASTRIPFDLMVLDNGSCEVVQDYLIELQKSGFIQYLILSGDNLGKVGAWNILFQSAPGEIVSFCDSDMYFLEDWLGESLEILDHFPKAGIVTAVPIAGGDLSALKTTKLAEDDPNIEITSGLLIPDEYLRACIKSLGQGQEEYDKRQINRKDVLLTIDGIDAFATASHFQFTTKKSILTQLFPAKPEYPLAGDLQFEDEMVDKGYWRLSTKGYYVHHMGNRVPDLQSELDWLDFNLIDSIFQKQPSSEGNRANKNKCISRLLQSSRIRRVIKKIHTLSYRILYE